MTKTHPYTNTQAGLIQTISHLRQSFPPVIEASTLKKLGIAPKNESYILNVLQFLDLIDEKGNKSDAANRVFNLHDDEKFSKDFSSLVKTAYGDLFELHDESAWGLEMDSLISFFRGNDSTTAIVGKRQASTFQLLAAFSGHGEIPELRQATGKGKSTGKSAKESPRQRARAKGKDKAAQKPEVLASVPVGLSVRIEVNLPADGDQATYDRIFRSIRENLLNG